MLTTPLADQGLADASRVQTLRLSAFLFTFVLLGLVSVVSILAIRGRQVNGRVHDSSKFLSLEGSNYDRLQQNLEYWHDHWFYVMMFGRLLLIYIFPAAAVNLGVSGFTEIARQFRYPCPTLMGCLAVLFLLFGSACVLLAPFYLDSVWCLVGGKCLIVFLLIASYSGHFKPMLAAEGEQRSAFLQSLLKNVSIVGALLFMFGHELPFMTEHYPPQLAWYYKWWQVHAYGLTFVGRALMALIFFVTAITLGPVGFMEIAEQFEYRCVGCMGFLGFTLALLGSILVAAGPFLPSRLYSIFGADALLLFLVVASYSGHWKPMRQSGDRERSSQMQALMKNISMIGGFIMLIGYDLAALKVD